MSYMYEATDISVDPSKLLKGLIIYDYCYISVVTDDAVFKNAGLEISEIFGNEFSISCIIFMENCQKPFSGSVNFDHENLFFL